MKRELTSTFLIVATVMCSIICRSCANTTTPPSGGPKDTIPPTLLKITPEFNTTGFPITGGKIQLDFDEYTVIKSMADIYISPVTKKRPVIKVKGKSIILTFNDTLSENTTYTIDFGNAFADNNEGNLFPRTVYTFSTGDIIDSMYFTGRVVDCESLLPISNALVAIYTDQSDSACITQAPLAATKTDEWGFFAIRNIKPIPYRVFAFTDGDGDSKYAIGADQVAFLDSLLIPVKVVDESIYELQGFDMKDTLKCQARSADIEMRMFQEYPSRQYILEKGRVDMKMGFIKFAAKDAMVNSFNVLGVDSGKVITQFSQNRDSLSFWINEKSILPDSLMVSINYMKTDSLNHLSAENEMLIVAMSKEDLAKARSAEGRTRAAADTLINFSRDFDNSTVEQNGIRYMVQAPLIECNMDSIIMTSTNPRNQIDTIEYVFHKDSTDIRRFVIQAKEKYQAGYKYELSIHAGAMRDVYGRKNAEEHITFNLPNDDNLSSITLNVNNVHSRYIIELVDRDKKTTFRKFIINEDSSILFPYIKSGEYSFRITEDRNGNGVFDHGDMLRKIQPENVIIFKLEDGSEVFIIPEQADIIQDITL